MRKLCTVTPLFLGLLVASGLLLLRTVSAQTAGGSFAAPPTFGPGGLAFAVFNPGTPDELQAAAARVGANGVWAQGTDGRSYLLAVDGPAFLSEAFRAAMPVRFAVPTAVVLTRTSDVPAPPVAPSAPAATPTPRATPTPAPAATPPAATPGSSTTPKANVPVGAPAKEIALYGDLRDDSRTKFALDFAMIDTNPAIRAGATAAEQEVTYARACRWRDGVQPFLCTDEVGPATSNIRPRIQTYLFDVPAPGQSVLISVQLCNARGCGEYVFIGSAVTKDDGTFYSVGSPFSGSNRVRVHSIDPRIARIRVTYSDGLVAYDVECGGIGGCSGGNLDNSIAPGATVSSLTLSGESIGSQSIVLRGTIAERATQQRAFVSVHGAAYRFDSGLVPNGNAESRGLNVRVGESQMIAGISALNGDREVVATLRGGTSVTWLLKRYALPERASAKMSLFDAGGIERSRLPAGTEAVFGAYVEGSRDGILDLDVQSRLQFILPASAVPVGTNMRDLTVVMWDGRAWAPVSDSATLQTNGTIRVDMWFKASGLYLITRVVA